MMNAAPTPIAARHAMSCHIESDMVAADRRTKLTAVLKQLDKAADELHHAGEDKNADAAGLALKKMKGLLPAVEGLYPAGALN